MSYRIAVDTGGTFTDVVISDSSGANWLSKSLTDTSRAFNGIAGAVDDVARQAGTTSAEIFATADLILYGTTRSTNAVVEAKTDRTALICTKGFRDTLYLREGGKLQPFNYHMAYPKPYIPRHLTFEVDERVTADGSVLRALDERSVEAAVEAAIGAGCKAIAVSLLWSMLYPQHELAVERIVERIAPGVSCTLSHRLNPIVREYRRTSSTAIDASLKPLMQQYLRDLGDDLSSAGFHGNLLLATSFGGAWEAADVIEKPIYSIGSGPAMAPRAVLSLLSEPGMGDFDDRAAIVCDVGGTSFDVSVVANGEIFRTNEAWLGERFQGDMLGVSCVDVRSIGAGGGSIAWIDDGGLLRLGPHSAGASPGPVAYGRGGELPTVTDAAAALDYLDPESFLGGRMALDVDAARGAIERYIARPLDLDVDQAANGILRLACEAMVSAIKEVTINQGVDPRTAIIVSGGGAGGINIANIAAELECDEVLVPSFAGVMSAWGGHMSDIVTEARRTLIQETGSLDIDAVNDVLCGLDEELDQKVARLEVRVTEVRKEFFVEARYKNQLWELLVPLDEPRFDPDVDLKPLVERFHEIHERHYSVRDQTASLEILTWIARLTVTYRVPQESHPIARVEKPGAETSSATSLAAYFADLGRVEAVRHRSDAVAEGMRIEGPAFVDEPTTTLVVPPEWAVQMRPGGHYLLTRSNRSQ